MANRPIAAIRLAQRLIGWSSSSDQDGHEDRDGHHDHDSEPHRLGHDDSADLPWLEGAGVDPQDVAQEVRSITATHRADSLICTSDIDRLPLDDSIDYRTATAFRSASATAWATPGAARFPVRRHELTRT
jgi:hypothetical protein